MSDDRAGTDDAANDVPAPNDDPDASAGRAFDWVHTPRVRDATLAAIPLSILGVGFFLDVVAPRLPWLFVGVVGGLAAELLATRWSRRVQALWSLGAVRVGAVAATIAVVGGALVVGDTSGIDLGDSLASLLAGGLCSYLALLVVLTWIDRRP